MSLYFSLKKVKSAERGSWDDLVTVCDYFWLKQILLYDTKCSQYSFLEAVCLIYIYLKKN